MGGIGPAPKDPSQRARRNAAPSIRELTKDGEVRGPNLPPTVYISSTTVQHGKRQTSVEEREWPIQTLRWWKTWRESALAQDFSETDWDFLMETASLHANFWYGNLEVAAELRLRVAKFGATPEDRQRLRVKVTNDGESSAPAVVKPISSARERYGHLKAV